MRSDLYQLTLISLGVVATSIFAVFIYREAFPEYKIYQKKYIALEDFRSTYTNEAPPEFNIGIRQIVQTREDLGPAKVDRCISCHVALSFPHFSPTKIAKDIDGNIIYDQNGIPEKIPNPDDVWTKLDLEIKKLESENRISESEKLKALKTATVGDHVYDVTKVLKMHPLMGAETRAFEFHSINEYGCTSCHNGNGQGLTTKKAHGPIEDGQYEIEFEGAVPLFKEIDEANDPKFSRRYNGKPGHQLIFQTTPIFVGALIQAKCMQCHQSTEESLKTVNTSAKILSGTHQNKIGIIQRAFNNDQATLLTLLNLYRDVENEGVSKIVENLRKQKSSYLLNEQELLKIQANLDFLLMTVGGEDGLRIQNEAPAKDVVLQSINRKLLNLVGSQALLVELISLNNKNDLDSGSFLDEFLINNKDSKEATGSLFKKLKILSSESLTKNPNILSKFNNDNQGNPDKLPSDVDLMTQNFQRGKELYISQSCYACHRIAALARGGVGPDLTEIGKGYPWYIKQKMVWPQSTLRNSTMPNFHLDHIELEDLMTFLLGQTGQNKSISDSMNIIHLKEWEAGQKNDFEKPISPTEIYDLNKSMIIFATEGCAACHRLKGFVSDTGFEIEKNKTDFKEVYKAKEWFKNLIPEDVVGSKLAEIIEKNSDEIDKQIVNNLRTGSILEEIEKKFPDTISSFYTDFAFASRAKNHEYSLKLKHEKDPLKKQEILNKLEGWKKRVRRVLLVYIQEYGLGRIIGPKPNWSGIYRSDEWLMQHFRNPSALIPNSIMPIFPFDDTKFYSLTHMLNVLGIKNRDETRLIWEHFGFKPQMAYEIHCAECHGNHLGGNGPVSEWIYPIPKNLRNADFLRNLTKENAVNSILHGVKGTPMAPWGEIATDVPPNDAIAVLSKPEIESIVDWIYSKVPNERGMNSSDNILKWLYEPSMIHDELKNEGNILKENILPKKKSESINDAIFEIKDNLINSPEKNSYFIKQKYYTEENIEQGKKFFLMNCAVCHGKEADGTGARGQVMLDAKPRNLINIEWIDKKDDLRLLRSIKYGVAGTSMGAWGDLTSSLQRLQLVIFIRHLNLEADLRKSLSSALYEAFDTAILTIEDFRSTEFKKIDQLKSNLKSIDHHFDHEELAVDSFKRQLKLEKELKGLENEDLKLVKLQNLIKDKSKIYQQIGLELIGKQLSPEVFSAYFEIINLNKGLIELIDQKLIIHEPSKIIGDITFKRDQIVKIFNNNVKELENEKQLLENLSDSEEKTVKLIQITSEIKGYEKLNNSIYSGLRRVFELMKLQHEVLNNDKI